MEFSRSDNKRAEAPIDITEKRGVYFRVMARQKSSLQFHEFSRITAICLLPVPAINGNFFK